MRKQWIITMPVAVLAVAALGLVAGCEPHEPTQEWEPQAPPPPAEQEWPPPEQPPAHQPEQHEPPQDPGPIVPEQPEQPEQDDPDEVETIPWPTE